MQVQLVTPPLIEPILLEEAKTYLKIDVDDDDAYIESAIKAAREMVEQFTNRKLVSQAWLMTTYVIKDYFDLPFAPLISISHVKAIDEEGTKTATTSYVLDNAFLFPRIRLTDAGYPSNYEVQATYGYSIEIPEPLTDALRMLMAEKFENRHLSSIPENIKAVLRPFRLLSF